MSALFSIAHVHIYSQYLTVALMAFQLLKMEHFTTIPQCLALWLLLNALITLHCLENLKEPVSILAGPTQTQLVVRNGLKCGSICERSMPLLRGERGLASLCTVT